jgi:hypothetical protein
VSDPWADPAAKVWVEHVLAEMAPKLENSAVSVSLVPTDRHGDVKFWVELGASIMMDKPIIAVVFDNAPVPAKLRLVADEIVKMPGGVNPNNSQALAAAIHRVLNRERP